MAAKEKSSRNPAPTQKRSAEVRDVVPRSKRTPPSPERTKGSAKDPPPRTWDASPTARPRPTSAARRKAELEMPPDEED